MCASFSPGSMKKYARALFPIPTIHGILYGMEEKHTDKYTSAWAEDEDDRLSSEDFEEAEEDEVSLEDDFQSRRRGPDLRLPLGLLVTLLLLGGVGYFLWQYMRDGTASAGATLIINEVCAVNHQSLVSEKLGTPDWLELYNGSSKAIRLKGYGLTDNPKQSYKYTLPDVTIEPGGYLIVYFTGGSEEADSDPLCTGFGLSRYGENLLLVDANYNLLDSVEVPSLEADVSYARSADGSWGYAVIPTPGEPNGDVIPAWN